MKSAHRKVHKHLRLDNDKLKRVQKVLGARTETETIERALDRVLSEEEKDEIVRKAHERFFQSGAKIKDVFEKL
jgi:predicted transcriptional regulator YheO